MDMDDTRLCYDQIMKALGLIAVTVMSASTAMATTMMPLDLKALVQRADRVALVTVLSSESHWTEGHDAIYTDAVVRVDRVYKGAVKSGETVMVRREGGSVDGVGMRVHGSPVLSPGEQAVVFLEARAGASWVVGMAQGKWHVATESGKKMVHADLSGIGFVQPGPTALAGPRALADVEKEIRAEVSRSAK
jgi:hypothetical protein